MGFDPTTKHKTTTTVLGPIELGKYALLRDEKTLGTDGGTFTAGDWRTRDLNTKAVDEIGVTLSSNQFTLAAGTYRFLAWGTQRLTGNNRLRLQNVTDATTVIIGECGLAHAGTSASNYRAGCEGSFTITASKTFELQHRCNTTRATDGFGNQSNIVGPEVFASIELLKVA